MSDLLIDRRQYRRSPLAGDVMVRLDGVEGDFPLADISLAGVCVEFDRIKDGETVCGRYGVCRIEAPDLACPIEALISVRRIRKVGRAWQAGMRFESISEEHRRVILAYQALSRARQSRQQLFGGNA